MRKTIWDGWSRELSSVGEACHWVLFFRVSVFRFWLPSFRFTILKLQLRSLNALRYSSWRWAFFPCRRTWPWMTWAKTAVDSATLAPLPKFCLFFREYRLYSWVIFDCERFLWARAWFIVCFYQWTWFWFRFRIWFLRRGWKTRSGRFLLSFLLVEANSTRWR
jgi:hypothetical protein